LAGGLQRHDHADQHADQTDQGQGAIAGPDELANDETRLEAPAATATGQ
jgi:hypothetical protein